MKHQITIPIDAMRSLEAGERVIARAEGPGRVVLERQDDVLERFSGSLTGVFGKRILVELRNEWDYECQQYRAEKELRNPEA